jgi:hypothetical protein
MQDHSSCLKTRNKLIGDSSRNGCFSRSSRKRREENQKNKKQNPRKIKSTILMPSILI